MPTDFTKPDPNDAATKRSRNNNLSQFLVNNSDDIVECFLETLSSGATQWQIVYRDGTKDPLPNP